MELKNDNLEFVDQEVDFATHLKEYMLEFTSNAEGDDYKITINGEDWTKNWDLFLQIYSLVDDVINFHDKIITHLMIVKKADGTIKADAEYFDGNASEIKRYNPFE